eukprot:1157222-Pelagomonas_calceolata.AAC.12
MQHGHCLYCALTDTDALRLTTRPCAAAHAVAALDGSLGEPTQSENSGAAQALAAHRIGHQSKAKSSKFHVLMGLSRLLLLVKAAT